MTNEIGRVFFSKKALTDLKLRNLEHEVDSSN